MSTLLMALNRVVAPFMCGVCMAATTKVSDPAAIAFLLGWAAMFAFLGFELGSKIMARFGSKPAEA